MEMEIATVYSRQSRGNAKSIDEQMDEGVDVAHQEGWQLGEKYSDGSSASRYARKARDDWQRVLDDIAHRRLTILILWESSRGDRNLTSWSHMLDLCREHGVRIYVISHERLYDPRKHRDWKSLAEDGIASASETDLLSVRVRRGHAGAAKSGRPSHGRAPTGYRRAYDPSTGKLTGQEIDPVHAPTVREIVARVAAGDPISVITDDLNARAVPTVGAARWYRQRVRDIAGNRAYIGERVYNGQAFPGEWPALVEADIFYAAQRVLGDPARVTTKPGSQKHLLSYLATCGPCGAGLTAVRGRYRCSETGCVTIVQEETDDLVERAVIGYLADPSFYDRIRQESDDSDQEIVRARTEEAELRNRLDGFRRSAAAGATSPESLAVIEAELKPQIDAAARRTHTASVPPFLREFAEPGADVEARWEDAPMPVRRSLVRTVAVVVVGPADRPGSRLWDRERLDQSRWVGDPLTWGQRWARG